MKKLWTLVVLVMSIGLARAAYECYAPVVFASPMSPSAKDELVASASRFSDDSAAVAGVLRTVKATAIENLTALPVEKFVLPPAGVDVLRIGMEGTYTVDGIGTDTIELSGWLACVHGEPYPAHGFDYVSWKTSIIDTQFVGFDIQGKSKMFGPVHVYLNPNQSSYGQAGVIEMPASAPARYLKMMGMAGAPTGDCPNPPNCPSGCKAILNLTVEMPQLGLKMNTAKAVRHYSYVETIPPAGTTPSFTVEPTPLVLDGRVVGTLENSTSKFREVVMTAPFRKSEMASR